MQRRPHPGIVLSPGRQISPAGPEAPYWLVFPDYDVKNRVKLEFPLGEHVTTLISEYAYEHRAVLLRGFNGPWLFPGESGGYKTPSMFSDQITQAVLKATGLRLTTHQFRHAAAALMLQHDPGIKAGASDDRERGAARTTRLTLKGGELLFEQNYNMRCKNMGTLTANRQKGFQK